ncbi:MAG: transglycosylase domain-containing protein, partial [Paracoccaceae bacterium]
MSGNQNNRPPLVADKRYPSQAEVAQKRAVKKPPPKPRPKPQLPETVSGWLWFALRILGWIVTLIWRFLWRGAAIATVILVIAVLYYAANLPPVSDLLDGRARGSVTLLDRNDEVFAWRGEQFGGQVDADTVSQNLKNAIIAAEDKRFYRHFGISPRGIASAARINMREGRSPLRGHGGSTISQQTAKLLCLGVPFDPTGELSEAEYEADCREGSIRRKIKEAVFAMAMELRYSKDQILTIYLNRAYLGAGSRGFEAASQRYFGISAADVDPAQSAMLAGLLTAPSRFAPTTDLQRSQDRATGIIALMQEQSYLTAAQAQDARTNPAQLSEAAAARAGGYFADWVMDSGPVFLTRETTEDVVIRTTFDQRIQDAAEQAVQQVFDGMDGANQEAQTAVVVMSADGAVRAMVGGRKFRGVAGLFNRAVQAKRQTGSAFKPFVYATALDLGFSYADTVLDEEITIDIPGSGPWTPRNYSEKFIGPVTL